MAKVRVRQAFHTLLTGIGTGFNYLASHLILWINNQKILITHFLKFIVIPGNNRKCRQSCMDKNIYFKLILIVK